MGTEDRLWYLIDLCGGDAVSGCICILLEKVREADSRNWENCALKAVLLPQTITEEPLSQWQDRDRKHSRKE